MERRAEAGRLILAGCCTGPGDPQWTCKSCDHAWGDASAPRQGPSEGKTQPSGGDITDRELEAMHERIDREIEDKGPPSDEELQAEIEELNRSAKS